jgi:hypothetical protein
VGEAGAALANRKTEVEIQKLQAEAAKAAGEPPKMPEIKTPEGSVDVSSTNGLIGRLLAYRMLDDEAREITRLIGAHEEALALEDEEAQEPLRVLLLSSLDLLSPDTVYWTVRAGVERELEELDRCHRELARFMLRESRERVERVVPERFSEGATVREAVLPALGLSTALFPPAGVAMAAAQAAGTLIGTMRTDYTVHGGEAKIEEKPLIAAIAHQVLGRGWEPVVDGFDLVPESNLIALFDLVRLLAVRLQRGVDELRPRFPLDGGAGSEGDGDGESAGVRVALAEAETALKHFGEFTAQVTAAPSGGGRPPLLEAAWRGLLHEGGPAIDYVVFAGVEGGGQEVIAKHGFWPWSNRRVFYLGGAVGYHFVYHVEGRRTIAAGTKPLLGKVKFDLKEGEIEGEAHSITI